MKNRDIRARIYDLAAGKSKAEARIKNEIDTMTTKAEQLQREAEDALTRGDFETYKNSRREAVDLREYTAALTARLINDSVGLTDQEQDEIRDEIHDEIRQLEEETRARLQKFLPEIEKLKAAYTKELREYADAVNAWNELTGSEHRAYINNTGTARLLEQLVNLIKPRQ